MVDWKPLNDWEPLRLTREQARFDRRVNLLLAALVFLGLAGFLALAWPR